MNQIQIIEKTISFVKNFLKGNDSSHDWWHIERVQKLSKKIAEKEEGNILIIELAALLHEVLDYKFINEDKENISNEVFNFLSSLKIDKNSILEIEDIIKNISFSSSLDNKNFIKSKEFMIVQDADRLDALGAIGIARAFSYGGYKEREIHNPTIKPNLNMTKEEYRKSKGTTINHFYEKLFLLKDKMNTNTGKIIAEKREKFMRIFLKEFYIEWDEIL